MKSCLTNLPYFRSHNQALATSTDPFLNLRIDVKPFSEATFSDSQLIPRAALTQSINAGQKYVQNRLPGLFSMVQKAFNFVDEQAALLQPPRPPLTDIEFRSFLDSVGLIVHPGELRRVIYNGSIEPSLRRVVWKHIVNVYPIGMTGKERMDYMKRKAAEYYKLRECWRLAIQNGCTDSELAYVTSMVRKDVIRTDRLHPFYAGSDDNKNIASLFNILTTYALNHPTVSYCQGMSDIASPLLVVMADESHAYICFCALMRRLKSNFMLDGISMTMKFAHLTDALQYYDPEFYEYLRMQQADDLLFCYRWLLLEMKREFAFEDSLKMLEVLWSSLPPDPPKGELQLFDKEFHLPPIESQVDIAVPKSPNCVIRRETAYSKLCALRRSSALSLSSINHQATLSPSLLPSSASEYKLTSTKRLNQSMDESRTRVSRSVEATPKSNQSLDERRFIFPPEVSLAELEEKNETNAEIRPENINQNSIMSRNTNPFLSPSALTSGGHFKGLKERIAKKMSSVDSSSDQLAASSQKVVKNFNEFLNLAKSKGEKLNNNERKSKVEKAEISPVSETIPVENIVVEVESDQDTKPHGNSQSKDMKSVDQENSLFLDVKTSKISNDGISPDDFQSSQDYFPMTTSMTRELRLELESLDRQVFGHEFQKKQFAFVDCDTPESGDSVLSLGLSKSQNCRAASSEVAYTKLGQSSAETCEGEDDEEEEIQRCPSGINGYHKDEASLKRLSSCSANNDVFIWENPLHQTNPFLHASIEVGGEIIDETNIRKSITPIRLLRKGNEAEAAVKSNLITTTSGGNADSVEMGDKLARDMMRPLNSDDEEASEEAVGQRLSPSGLPPPSEFGGGNPFLIFLCLTLLQQVRFYA